MIDDKFDGGRKIIIKCTANVYVNTVDGREGRTHSGLFAYMVRIIYL